MIKHWKEQLRGKMGGFQLTGHNPPLTEVMAGPQAKNLKLGLLATPYNISSDQGTHSQPKKLSRNYRGTLLADLLLTLRHMLR